MSDDRFKIKKCEINKGNYEVVTELHNYGTLFIAFIVKLDSGGWRLTNNASYDVDYTGKVFKSRKDAAEAAYLGWYETYSPDALEKTWHNETVGGYNVKFVHSLNHCIVCYTTGHHGFQGSWNVYGQYTFNDEGSYHDMKYDLIPRI